MYRLTLPRLKVLKLRYHQQREGAVVRGIFFLLSFEEWLDVWISSGHLHERGNKRGQYCMARIGDLGPYMLSNVTIMLSSQNISEAKKGIPLSAEHRRKISIAHTGKTLAAAHRAKIAAGNILAWDRRRMEMLIEYCS